MVLSIAMLGSVGSAVMAEDVGSVQARMTSCTYCGGDMYQTDYYRTFVRNEPVSCANNYPHTDSREVYNVNAYYSCSRCGRGTSASWQTYGNVVCAGRP